MMTIYGPRRMWLQSVKPSEWSSSEHMVAFDLDELLFLDDLNHRKAMMNNITKKALIFKRSVLVPDRSPFLGLI